MLECARMFYNVVQCCCRMMQQSFIDMENMFDMLEEKQEASAEDYYETYLSFCICSFLHSFMQVCAVVCAVPVEGCMCKFCANSPESSILEYVSSVSWRQQEIVLMYKMKILPSHDNNCLWLFE